MRIGKIILLIILVIAAVLNALCAGRGMHPVPHILIALLDVFGFGFVLLAPQWNRNEKN